MPQEAEEREQILLEMQNGYALDAELQGDK